MRHLLVMMIGWWAGGCTAPVPAAPKKTDTSLTPPDTLVLQVGAYQVWLAEGRQATDSSGKPCYERSVEIGTDSTRTKVPLLYVTEVPSVLDQRHLRASLSLHCRPLADYRVELATGRPVKIGGR